MTISVKWAEPEDVVELLILHGEGRLVEIGDLLPEEAASLGIHRHRSWFDKMFDGRQPWWQWLNFGSRMRPGDHWL